MDDGGTFFGGLIVGAIAMLLFLLWASPASPNKSAREACQKAGFDGGVYDPNTGFVCTTTAFHPLKAQP